MKTVILTLAILCGLFSNAEARQRRATVAHPECNVTMPCEGVTTSARGERVVRAMGGFGTATKYYRERHATRHPVRYREPQVRRHRPVPVEIKIARATPQRIVSFGPVPDHKGIGPRPGRWCGWFMQHDTGVTSAGTGLNLNRAIEWRRVGQAAQPAIGVIVVWAHHVGRIVGGQPGAWVVRSGNDGAGQVRERVRADISRAVAFRSL